MSILARVLLMQLPVPNNPDTNVALAAGYLKAYAHSLGLLEQVAVDILPRDLADHAGDQLLVDTIVQAAPDMLAISLYTWNSERSLGIAQCIRARLPGLVVVIGGPEVQHDNRWVVEHAAVDVAVVGEGEQTFADLLGLLVAARRGAPGAVPALAPALLAEVPGIVYRDGERRVSTGKRQALADLSIIPSPYLLGYLEIDPQALMMIEVSRWCPYSCSFCLYGRNMGARLGSRLFPLQRLLDEIGWGLERGARRVHFVEANLNLVPLFKPLMQALAELHADRGLQFYAELRGEHLNDDTVALLAAGGLVVAEVGLQTANPEALRVARRRTDLARWAAGTRRLYEYGVEVLLDVIVGLPGDTVEGIAGTLAFIESERLGPFDAFTLQMLPGTAVRQDAGQYVVSFQQRPPYYVLSTDRLSFEALRRLRAELRERAGIDPQLVEGCPPPRLNALAPGRAPGDAALIERVDLLRAGEPDAALFPPGRLAAHIDLIASWEQLSGTWGAWLAAAIAANPSSLFDIYIVGRPPAARELAAWRAGLPYQPGYLDRVAIFRRTTLEVPHDRVSPRMWLVPAWTSELDPDDYAGQAMVVWRYDMRDDLAAPVESWERAGGEGIWVRDRGEHCVAPWRATTSMLLWSGQET
jgi:hypothetical protein